MPTPRTVTIVAAAAIVKAKVDASLATLDEGGDTAESRPQLTHYFAARRADQMMGNILADQTTETPTDVRATFEADARKRLEQAIYNAAIALP